MADLLECLFSCDIKKLKIIYENIDINYVIPDTDGCTALHIVAGTEDTNGKKDVLSFLLEMGADPNARSYENLTPVHIASMWGNCYELDKLLQNGGNPWLIDDENKNSFDMAADNHAYEAYQLLNTYLAQDKLNFKSEKKISSISTSACGHLVNLKEYFNNPKARNSKWLSVTTFMSANENFPLIFSSNDDESSDNILNVSKYLKKKTPTKSKQNDQMLIGENSDLTDSSFVSEQNETNIDLNANSADNKIKSFKKNYKNNWNHACAFSSSENESTLTENFNLNDSNRSFETIIEADDKSGIVLVEKIIPLDPSKIIQYNTSNNDYISVSSVSSSENDWKLYKSVYDDSSFPSYCSSHSKASIIIPSDLCDYSNSKIFQELQNMGDNPGPVLDHTRQVYLKRLARLRSGCRISCILPKPKYCPEVYLYLENKLDMARAQNLEKSITAEFDADTSKKWREGNQRCCFNYFLLDPRVTQNLPSRASILTPEQAFLIFLDSLFYVGKGTRGRPYNHLFEAAKSLATGGLKSDKINHILDIWESSLGVISLHCFHNSVPVEAYTREACIIEAIGLDNLTNIKKGDFYGSSARLTTSKKRLVGISLLDRAFQIFLLEGERQIKPKDVQNK